MNPWGGFEPFRLDATLFGIEADGYCGLMTTTRASHRLDTRLVHRVEVNADSAEGE